MSRPVLESLPVLLQDEIKLVEQDNLEDAFMKQQEVVPFLQNIPVEKWNYRYAEGKWSIGEVIQHIIDAERILCNRALVIARKDTSTPLLSFDENHYGVAAKAANRSKEDIISELSAVQLSTLKLFESFDEEQLKTTGTVNNYTIDVNALGFVICGHTVHHLNIIKERYF